MQYILDQNEYDALTPVKRLQEQNESLEIARKLIISDRECLETTFCSDCPIGKQWLESVDRGESGDSEYQAMNHLCLKHKFFPK